MTTPSILAINCGSSTIRFAAIDARSGERWLDGEADKLGEPGAVFAAGVEGGEPSEQSISQETTQEEALDMIRDATFEAARGRRDLQALAHRVVHGGDRFTGPAVINERVLQDIEKLAPMAPLHNPVAVKLIRAAQERFPSQTHIACFDTSFHRPLPRRAFLYALPLEYYEEKGIRRYGFHGFSHQRAFSEVTRILGQPAEGTNLISAHLGNGASVNATQGGASFDNSMGFTPLEGIVMGSRSGDVDPGLFRYLSDEEGMSIDEIDRMLSKESGLKGLSGISNDMRELRKPEAADNPRVDLAVEIFTYRLAKAIAAARVALDDLDAIAFTGGIGANDADTRARVARLLSFLGCQLDEEANEDHGKQREGLISDGQSRPALFVIPVNEEAVMVQDCVGLI